MKLHVSVTFYNLFIVLQNTVSDTKLVRSSECAMDEKIQREQISQLVFPPLRSCPCRTDRSVHPKASWAPRSGGRDAGRRFTARRL